MRTMWLWCPFMKRKEIITWIHDYPNWQMNFYSKKWCEVKFFLWNQSINSFIPMRGMKLWFLIIKRMGIIMWIYVYHSWKANINSKICTKRSFSYETKVSIPFIPIKRMCLWCLTTKRKEIIMWIHVNPNWKTNFNSKNGNKWIISYETKASISFIPTWRMCLWCPIMKWNEITMWIHVYSN